MSTTGRTEGSPLSGPPRDVVPDRPPSPAPGVVVAGWIPTYRRAGRARLVKSLDY